MALIVKDRVQELSTTVGTGTLTLGGAVLGFQSFAAIGDGNTTYYAINDPITGDWEAGIGTYTSSGTTLSRDTVLSSSNGGSLVSFAAGSKNVFCTYPSERAVYLDSAGSYPVQNTFNTLNVTTATITAGTVATTPTSGTDIANKSYVDTIAAAGIHYHTPVYVESPNTAGNLNATYNQPGGAGVGVGATLTNAGTQVALTIDGVLMTVGKRVLIYNQTNAFENGVYTVTTVGDGSTNWVLTRATDADTYAPSSPNSLGQGDAFFVTNGDTGAGEGYVCTTVGTITFGTTAITFSQFSSSVAYNAGTGLNLSPATTFNISNTAVTPATYGTPSSVGTFTVNAQGQITNAVDTPIAISSAAVSGLAPSATTDTTDASNITSGTLPSGRISGSYNGITSVGTLTGGTWNATPIGTTKGGTGLTTFTTGGILYAANSATLTQLAPVLVGNALISGGVGSAPSYGKIGLATHVSGTLPVANGGTGVTSSTGTGSVVLSTSPTLVTPNLGTPSTLVGTNITDLNASNLASGTVPDARISGSYTGMTNLTGTGDVDFARFLGNAGDTAALPSFTWTGDPNTGMFSPGADQVALTTGGTARLTVSTAQFTGTLPWRGQNGTAAAPALSASGDTNTGIYFPAADTIGFVEGGVERMRIASTGAIAFNGAANYGTSGQVLTSAGNAPPTWEAVAGIGVGQTWTNVTASRATGTTYTNSTGKPIMVVVTPVASGSLIGTFNISGSAVGVVQFTPSGGGGGSPFFYIIPNGVTYSVTNNANFNISYWWELR